MKILLQTTSDQPIYRQIADQIASQIIDGSLLAGEALPSVRVLARDLKISVITTTRSYSELEKDGLIASIAGKGFYVLAQDTGLLKERRLNQIESLLEEAVAPSKQSGIPIEELHSLLDTLLEGEDDYER